jgi:tRNA dimethylallyltransferase
VDLLRDDVEGMKRRTRNYARRQLTWLRRLPDVHLIDLTSMSVELAANEIAALVSERPDGAPR